MMNMEMTNMEMTNMEMMNIRMLLNLRNQTATAAPPMVKMKVLESTTGTQHSWSSPPLLAAAASLRFVSVTDLLHLFHFLRLINICNWQPTSADAPPVPLA